MNVQLYSEGPLRPSGVAKANQHFKTQNHNSWEQRFKMKPIVYPVPFHPDPTMLIMVGIDASESFMVHTNHNNFK